MSHINIHSHQHGILKFPAINSRLSLKTIIQYFPESTGLCFLNESGEEIIIDADNEGVIILQNEVKDYIVSYREGKRKEKKRYFLKTNV